MNLRTFKSFSLIQKLCKSSKIASINKKPFYCSYPNFASLYQKRLFSDSTPNKELTGKNSEKAENDKNTAEPKVVKINERHGDAILSENFRTETKEILDIVSKSIYTNKEIFMRELISNASDAIEQLRYLMNKSPEKFEEKTEFRIDITTDPTGNKIIIKDNGIGMTKKQLIENLGIIAKSGSKNFLKSVKEDKASANSIIGQFGVGFYSAFMASKKVEVYTRSSAETNSKSFYWVSDGKGTYSISEAKNVEKGTKIIINLDEDCSDFAKKYNAEQIIKRYSNFVEQPIFLNNEKINLQGALWLKDPKSLSEVHHTEFFKQLTNAYDGPLFHIHFHKDYPLSLHALLYIPKYHSEKYGNARMKPGISLYSRKVLIQKESPELLPDWLRFIKGVADSEDLTLNISRDSTQSSATLRRIRTILVKNIVARLRDTARRDPKAFAAFYKEYNVFLKEGACTDAEAKELVAPLLRFDSSHNKGEESAAERSLEDYLGAAKKLQKNIFYLVTTNRTAAENSPYFESFRRSGTEVLFLYTPLDEFVMQAIGQFDKRPLVSIESGKIAEEDLGKFEEKRTEFELSTSQTEDLCDWLAATLKGKVRAVVPTKRLSQSPAIVTGHENASVQVMMQLANSGREHSAPPQRLEINPSHAVVRGLFYTMRDEEALASKVAQQLFENAMVDAGLVKDARGMLGRVNDLMAAAMDVEGIELELKQKAAQRGKGADK